MRNPITQAEILAEWLQEILTTFPLGVKPKERIQGAFYAVESVIKELNDINDFIDLQLPDVQNPFSIYEEWTKSSEERISTGNQLFEQLIGASPTLKYLSMGGIETKRITKYTDAELHFAQVIGDNYKEVKNLIPWIASAINRDNPYITCNGYFYQSYLNLFAQLKYKGEQGLIVEKIELENEDKSFAEVEKQEPRKPRYKDRRVKIHFKPNHEKLRQLILGDWFNAYAYQVITAHLSLNRMEYELFTKVEYKAPAEISRFGSDFDLIGTIGERIIFVESKSGKIEKDSLIKEIIDRTQKIKDIFRKAKTEDTNFTSILLYNSSLKENNEVKQKVKEMVSKSHSPEILVIDPSEIRGTIMELTRNG